MIRIRPTERSDLDRVLEIENDPENTPFIGQWSRAEHLSAIERSDRVHLTIERPGDPPGRLAGYLIGYDLARAGLGFYVKRIVVAEKSCGLGRAALARFVEQIEDERGRHAMPVWLTVFIENERAQRAYAALDFRVLEPSDQTRRALHAAVGGFSDRSRIMSRGGIVPGGG